MFHIGLQFVVYSLLCFCVFFVPSQCLNRSIDCDCRIRVENRIVSGKLTRPNEFPWAISLGPWNVSNRTARSKLLAHSCGGILLNERWAMTAAHCVFASGYHKISPNLLAVGVGNGHLLTQMYDAGRVRVAQVLPHPAYRPDKPDSPGDLALLRLSNELPLTNQSLSPACLNTRAMHFGAKLLATGWGSVRRMQLIDGKWKGFEPTDPMRAVWLRDNSNQRCTDRPDLICVDSIQGTNGSPCKGDSGGPLHYVSRGKAIVLGLTSFGNTQQTGNGSTITCIGKAAYTRIALYLNWISSNIGRNFCYV